jgi:hypothetical protein
MGYHHKHFKLIQEKTIDLKAGESKEVEVSWDLSDLTETYGGKWPAAISQFDHFCVRVDLDPAEGSNANACNDAVQHNFAKVTTHKPAAIETAVVLANPFDAHGIEARITVGSTLPESWEAWLEEVPRDQDLALEAGELRVVPLRVEVPDEPWLRAPIDGAIEAELVGVRRGVIEARLTADEYDEEGGAFRGTLEGTIQAERRRSAMHGDIAGEVQDFDLGDFIGEVRLVVADPELIEPAELFGAVKGRIVPDRIVHVGEMIDGELVGGIELALEPRRR